MAFCNPPSRCLKLRSRREVYARNLTERNEQKRYSEKNAIYQLYLRWRFLQRLASRPQNFKARTFPAQFDVILISGHGVMGCGWGRRMLTLKPPAMPLCGCRPAAAGAATTDTRTKGRSETRKARAIGSLGPRYWEFARQRPAYIGAEPAGWLSVRVCRCAQPVAALTSAAVNDVIDELLGYGLFCRWSQRWWCAVFGA